MYLGKSFMLLKKCVFVVSLLWCVPLVSAHANRVANDVFKDCEDCPEMVVVPAGSFRMGDLSGKGSANEKPVRQVNIDKFVIGKYEVTFDQWDACVADGGCNHSPSDSGWGRGNRPVMDVSWNDVTKQYIPWLNRKTGKTYRLPSEAEWEYAARAGTETEFWWGDSINTSQANYDGKEIFSGSPKGEYRGKTVPVDGFNANPFGLYNVHGNVWEWVQDCWNKNYEGAPSNGRAWEAGDCTQRVLRGGNWFNPHPGVLRSCFRERASMDSGDFRFGFRLARSL